MAAQILCFMFEFHIYGWVVRKITAQCPLAGGPRATLENIGFGSPLDNASCEGNNFDIWKLSNAPNCVLGSDCKAVGGAHLELRECAFHWKRNRFHIAHFFPTHVGQWQRAALQGEFPESEKLVRRNGTLISFKGPLDLEPKLSLGQLEDGGGQGVIGRDPGRQGWQAFLLLLWNHSLPSIPFDLFTGRWWVDQLLQMCTFTGQPLSSGFPPVHLLLQLPAGLLQLHQVTVLLQLLPHPLRQNALELRFWNPLYPLSCSHQSILIWRQPCNQTMLEPCSQHNVRTLQ